MRKIRKEQIEYPHDYESSDVLVMNSPQNTQIVTNRADGKFYAQFHFKLDMNEYEGTMFEVNLSSAHYYRENRTSIDNIKITFIINSGRIIDAFVNVTDSMLDFKSNQIQVMWRHDFEMGVVIEITEKGYLNEYTLHWIDSIKLIGHTKRFEILVYNSSATCNPDRNGNARTHLFQGSDLDLLSKISSGKIETFHSNKYVKITTDFFYQSEQGAHSNLMEISPRLITPIKIYGLGIKFSQHKLLHFVDNQQFEILIERYRSKRNTVSYIRGRLYKNAGFTLEKKPDRYNRGNIMYYHLNSQKRIDEIGSEFSSTAYHTEDRNILNNGTGSYMFFNQAFYFAWNYESIDNVDTNDMTNVPHAFGFKRKHTRSSFSQFSQMYQYEAFVWLGLRIRFRIRGKEYTTPILGKVKMVAENRFFPYDDRRRISTGIISYRHT